MKIAMLLDQQSQSLVLDPKTISLLAAAGSLVWNETNENDIENARAILKDADVAVTSWGSPAFTPCLLDMAPDLKLVLHAAGSVKSIVTDELYRRGIRVVSSACVLSSGVSETALGLTIAACKNFFALNQEIREGKWSHTGITDLYDITVGILGMGIAGSHFAELLQNFSVNVIACDPLVSQEQMNLFHAEKVDLDTLFSRSDVLSLHAPIIESTHHIVNGRTLSLMKEGSILINTARGALVDEKALIEALQNGRLKYACLDVTDPEPPVENSPLRSLPNCILTPHLAGQAGNGLKKIGRHCYEELVRYINGEPLKAEIIQNMLANIA